MGCWATKDGRESLEGVNSGREIRTRKDCLPEDLQGDGVRFLDRIVGSVSLVAHACSVIPVSISSDIMMP